MSNALAIAAVTAVMKDLLNNGLIDQNVSGSLGGNVTVTALPPDIAIPLNGESSEDTINLFLYHVTPNQGWRNVSLPSRDAAGERLSNPPLALDLHYLITAYSQQQYHAEILLGYAMQLLHETPILTREAIRTALRSPSPVDGSILPAAFRALAAAELAEQVEQVKICPASMGTEEMSKLWSAFQTHYRPTAAYQVSVVLIESRRSTRSPLPVQSRNLRVLPFNQLRIDRVSPEIATPGSQLTIRGQHLQGDRVRVRFGSVEVEPVSGSSQQIEVVVPAGAQAGINSVQVVHGLDFGTPFEPHSGFESNVVPIVLRPVISGAITASASSVPGIPIGAIDITIPVQTTITPDQRVVLLLNELNGTTAYTFIAPKRDQDAGSIIVTVTGVESATYIVRIQADGAESLLDLDTDRTSPTFNQYLGTPNVAIACAGNCLRSSIALTQTTVASVITITGQITIQTEASTVVSGVTVSIRWTLPNGISREELGVTNSAGLINFVATGSTGTYQLSVLNLSKHNYSFDAQNSTLNGSITG